MTKTRIARVMALAAIATACAGQAATPPRPERAAVQTALNAQLTNFAKAITSKDPAAIANMFTVDGTWILPDASKFSGRKNIEMAAKNYFVNVESFIMSQVIMDKLIVVSDSEAVTFSHGNYTLTEQGKATTKRVNPVADYWMKGADGVWRVAYELNADGPAASATATTR